MVGAGQHDAPRIGVRYVRSALAFAKALPAYGPVNPSHASGPTVFEHVWINQMDEFLLENASYDSDSLKIPSRAFDETWIEMAEGAQKTQAIEDRRNRLAIILLALAAGGVRNSDRLKMLAHRFMDHAEISPLS
jgi:hypothetical protein